jgi:hypothetical protein
VLCAPVLGTAAEPPRSSWVHAGSDDKLEYKSTPAGDRIMDFSSAGYLGGGSALPEVPVKVTVKPLGGKDDTAAIQAAIDDVGQLPLKDGFRGAVLLGEGTFVCAKPLILAKSGVVLRGSGSGAGGTSIAMTGPRHRAIIIGSEPKPAARRPRGSEDEEPEEDVDEAGRPAVAAGQFKAAETAIVDAYVPAGARTFTVRDAAGFAVGDTVAIHRPTTPAWLRLMQMDTMKRDGKPQIWIGVARGGVQERKILALSGTTMTLDLPLADSYDAKYLNPPGATVAKIKRSAGLSRIGVEHLHIQCPPLETAYGSAPYSGLLVGADDCWANDVYFEETMNTTVLKGRRITMEKVVVTHTYPNLGASKPTDFSIEGTQILIDRCRVIGDNEYFVWTASLYPGPNVVLNSTFNGRGSRIQPHMRWSTGLLVDNCRVPDGGIDYANRGVAGSGHGWTMGWAVAWNCLAKTYVIQNPPGAANWAIGCVGERVLTPRYFDTGPILPEGIFDAHGAAVAPRSLYLAQLRDRLGSEALKAVGYGSPDDPALTAEKGETLPARPDDIDPVLGPDLALYRPIDGRNMKDNARQYAGEKAVDRDEKTYWATNGNGRPAVIVVDTEGPLEIDAAVLEEAPDFRGNVREYTIEGQVDSDWKLLAKGTAVGERKVDRFPRTTVWKVRLTIVKAEPFAAIRKFGLYRKNGE